MKIVSKTRLSMAVILICASVASILYVWTAHETSNANQKDILADEITLSCFRLALLTQHILLHPEETRPKHQWQRSVDRLTALLLHSAREMPSAKPLLDKMRKSVSKLKSKFDKFQDVPKGEIQDAPVHRERHWRLSSSVAIVAESIVFDASRLSHDAHSKIAALHSRVAIILISMVVFIIVGGLLMWRVSRSILIPLIQLMRGAAVVASGNLSYRTGIHTNDELGDLSSAFDKMLSRLQETMAHRDQLDMEVCERKKAQAALMRHKNELEHLVDLRTESLRKLSQAVEQSPALVLITDTNGTIEYVNPKFTQVTGYSREECIGQNPRLLKSGLHDQKFYTELWETISAGKTWQGEIVNKRKNGETYWEAATIAALRNKKGDITHYTAVLEDISLRKEKDELLRKRVHELAEARQALLSMMEDLSDAKQAAESANRAKSTFLANMSHEIRTPMNAVLGYAQLLLRSPTLEDEHREQIEIIHKSGTHLLALINDILEMSKIEAGRTVISRSTFDLRGLLDEMIVMFQELANKKSIELSVQIDDNLLPSIEGDIRKVRQVLINLISNAIKFTSSGSVRIFADSTPIDAAHHRVSIEVVDTGCGIEEANQGKIFNAFEQTDAGIQQGGTGLGMAISKKFAQLMGGDISFQSKEGEGSRFLFEFETSDGTSVIYSVLPEVAIPLGLLPEEKRRKVLIVDDVDTNRNLMVAQLSSVGFETCTAKKGEEAIVETKRWHPDLILMDIRMPGMGGIKAIQQIRLLNESVSIIAVSASVTANDQQEVSLAGADAFLAKPHTDAQLYEKIRQVMDIAFVYDNEGLPSSVPPGRYQHPGTLTKLIAKWPSKLIEQLRNATLSAEIDHIERLLDEAAEYSPEAASELHLMVDAYQYEAVLSALDFDTNVQE